MFYFPYKAHENKQQVQSCYEYFSSGKETSCPHSGPIRSICRHRMMENILANGLVIYLIVPKKDYVINIQHSPYTKFNRFLHIS